MYEKFLKFVPIAREVAKLSKDRRTKVGCVVLDDACNVRALSYNGFPRGMDDQRDERHVAPVKYKFSAHAEENSVSGAARIGVSLQGCSLLVTSMYPCTTCSRLIIQSGIARIFAPAQMEVKDNNAWAEDAKYALEMLKEVGVQIVTYCEAALLSVDQRTWEVVSVA